MRCCRGSDTHANTFSDPNRDSYGDCNCNANCNCNAYDYTYTNSDIYAYGYSDGYSELHAQAGSHAKASPDARTAPVVRPSVKTVRRIGW